MQMRILVLLYVYSYFLLYMSHILELCYPNCLWVRNISENVIGSGIGVWVRNFSVKGLSLDENVKGSGIGVWVRNLGVKGLSLEC